MSSELRTLLAHCRRMAATDRPVVVPGRTGQVVCPVPTPTERDLWTRIADEIDTHLTTVSDPHPTLDGTVDHPMEEPT